MDPGTVRPGGRIANSECCLDSSIASADESPSNSVAPSNGRYRTGCLGIPSTKRTSPSLARFMAWRGLGLVDGRGGLIVVRLTGIEVWLILGEIGTSICSGISMSAGLSNVWILRNLGLAMRLFPVKSRHECCERDVEQTKGSEVNLYRFFFPVEHIQTTRKMHGRHETNFGGELFVPVHCRMANIDGLVWTSMSRIAGTVGRQPRGREVSTRVTLWTIWKVGLLFKHLLQRSARF